MAQGNPNPSPATRFQPGNRLGQGKTSAQRKREIANAERATKLRGRLICALEKRIDEMDMSGDSAAVAAIQADILKLLKDTEDRGFGTPTAKVEGPGENGEHLHQVQDVTTEHLIAQAARLGIDPVALGLRSGAEEKD